MGMDGIKAGGIVGTYNTLKDAQKAAEKHQGNEIIVKDKETGQYTVLTKKDFSQAKLNYSGARFEPVDIDKKYNISGKNGFLADIAKETEKKDNSFELIEFSIETENVPTEDPEKLSLAENEKRLNGLADNPDKLKEYIGKMDINSIGWLVSNAQDKIEPQVKDALSKALNERKDELSSNSPYQKFVANPSTEAIKHFSLAENEKRLNGLADNPDKLKEYIGKMDINSIGWLVSNAQDKIEPQVKDALTKALNERKAELPPSSPYKELLPKEVVLPAFKESFAAKDMITSKNEIPYLKDEKAMEMVKLYNDKCGTNYTNVKELQTDLGVKTDSLIGQETFKAFQQKMNSIPEHVTPDPVLNTESIKDKLNPVPIKTLDFLYTKNMPNNAKEMNQQMLDVRDQAIQDYKAKSGLPSEAFNNGEFSFKMDVKVNLQTFQREYKVAITFAPKDKTVNLTTNTTVNN